jgi:PPM family protein phosphatase
MPMLALNATAFTHVGAVRAHNEDTIAVGDWVMSESMDQPLILDRVVERPCVCLVADGMGGHAAGDVASWFAAEYLVEHAAEAEDDIALDQMLREVDRGLFTLMRARPALDGMGTTVAGLHIAPAAVYVFNVGDSRVYRIDQAGLCQLSTDDTPGPKLADGRTALHTTSLLSQALGGEAVPGEIKPHVLREPIESERRYLICSDGLTDELEVEELFGLIGADDGASATALFQAAMAAGGHDNISIVLVRLRPA